MKQLQKCSKLLVLLTIIGCLTIDGFITNKLIIPIALAKPRSDNSADSERPLNNIRCLEIEDEAQYFYESSGFQMPPNAQIILSCDNHSGFHWDGEYYIVFDTTPEVIAAYLELSAWNTTWQNKAVPQEISSHTALFHWNNSAFSSSESWYLAENRNTFIPFHNGRLMVIVPNENRILYSQWDF